MLKSVFFAIIAVIFIYSCQKQSNVNGNGSLFIPVDSVFFDTIFTSTGAITQKVKLVNNNNDAIAISSVQLMGGANSPFIINIDGSPGPDAFNLQIPGNDSLYIFVTVFVKPGTTTNPFILRDSIRISYNGNNDLIQLSAWGQNAHFLTKQEISSNTNWTNDLPYVINGGLTVDSNVTLTVQPGVHIYMHADALVNINGTLKVLGDTAANQRVYFTGDRLDQPYAAYPGSWPGIYFTASSKDNQLNYAVFQNGYHSLVVEGPSPDLNPKLTLNQCLINNSYSDGLLSIQSSISAVNCLISNCGKILLSVLAVHTSLNIAQLQPIRRYSCHILNQYSRFPTLPRMEARFSPRISTRLLLIVYSGEAKVFRMKLPFLNREILLLMFLSIIRS